jgi:hypothetical protein
VKFQFKYLIENFCLAEDQVHYDLDEDEDGSTTVASSADTTRRIGLGDRTDSLMSDALPSFTEAMASRRNSTAVFIGHDDFKEYMSPPVYAVRNQQRDDNRRVSEGDEEDPEH